MAEDPVSSQLKLRHSIDRNIHNLKKIGAGKVTTGTLTARLEQLEKTWEKFDIGHTIVMNCPKQDEEYQKYLETDVFGSCEEAYLTAKAYYLDQLAATPVIAAPSNPGVAANSSRVEIASSRPLPKITLPRFSGTYQEWISFRDLFKSMVDSNRTLSDVEKLHYLKTNVIGDAAKLIASIPIAAENYARAWQKLESRFENKRALISSQLDTLFALKPVSSRRARELERLLSTTSEVLEALSALGAPVDQWDWLLVYFLSRRLDPESVEAWEFQLGSTTEPPSYAQLYSFMEGRVRALEQLDSTPAKTPGRAPHHAKPSTPSPARSFATSQAPCTGCGGSHYLSSCDIYQRKSPSARRDFVRERKLCFNCLGPHHLKACRSQKRCFQCSQPHHTSIHEAMNSPGSQLDPTSSPFTPPSRVLISTAPAPVALKTGQTLLATALVEISSPQGRDGNFRSLLDQGSELSFVSEAVVQSLKLPRVQSRIPLLGIGATGKSWTRGAVNLKIKSLVYPSFELTFLAHVLPRITGTLPPQDVPLSHWTHLNGLPLADPLFHRPGNVDVLLGADVYGSLITGRVAKGQPTAPIAQHTHLGWIVSGPTEARPSSAVQSFTCSPDYELLELVRKFWAQESLQESHQHRLSKEEQESEDHFKTTHRRLSTGRYEVRLPFKSEPTAFGDAQHIAEKMLTNLHRRFQRDTELHHLYSAFLEEYLALGHMEPSSRLDAGSFYLPHHGVLRKSSATTKLRVVFNGSQATSTGVSLNDCLHAGAKLQSDLTDVILRWRLHAYVFTADIEKMYRQISVHPDDRKFQKILWRARSDSPVQAFQLTTVTYGLTCAPFLAIRTLHQLAQDEGANYPAALAIVHGNMYVDDVLAGADSIEDAQDRIVQVDRLLQSGGFPLQKWTANHPSLLSQISPQRHATALKTFEESQVNALGLTWNPVSDSFVISYSQSVFQPVSSPTRRSVLSTIAKLFDPLGWLAPVIVAAKIFLQALWKGDLQWDDPLSPSLTRRWARFLNDCCAAEPVELPRWVHTSSSTAVQLHGFSDASQAALSAVVYVRVAQAGDSGKSSLLIAKTKVAPLKRVTIARLELSAAVLLAQLLSRVLASINLAVTATYCWTDSSVALTWIRGSPSQWKEFVGNRVALIQELLPDATWSHVAGTDNPADVASRGLSPTELSSYQPWWRGPEWLSHPPALWPQSIPPLTHDSDLELKPPVIHSVRKDTSMWELIDRYSSLSRLLRVTARTMHAVQVLRRKDSPSAVLQPLYIEKARLFWVKATQAAHFGDQLGILNAGAPLPKSCSLSRLTPFVDSDGLLRLGGRLKNSSLGYEVKHPLIVPDSSRLCSLIIEDTHRRLAHAGVQLTLAQLREEYWLIKGRLRVRSHLLKCVTCSRQRAKAAHQMMGHLPSVRLAPSRPFLSTGVDYAGPFSIRPKSGRNCHVSYKAYLVVFVCMATSAVHLELTTDYTSAGFIAAFRRFTGRRGIPRQIYSDNGLNLVGADTELKQMFTDGSKELGHIRDLLATDRTEWIFIPPSAPHFGGKWESAVKSAKHHIRRVIGDHLVTYEEFSTFLAEVEGILNSRPLCPLSEDPDDFSALTPGHFLIGGPIASLPEASLADEPKTRLSRWQHLRQLTEHFWSRWQREYLQKLQDIAKWRHPQANLQINSLALLIDERFPPSKWPMARVTAVHPGPDGLVRVVTVKLAGGQVFKRPVVKLCPLPVEPATPDPKPQEQ